MILSQLVITDSFQTSKQFSRLCLKEAYLEPRLEPRVRTQHLRRSFFAKMVNGEKPLTIFAKKLHRRCSTGLKTHQCFRIPLSEVRVGIPTNINKNN